MLCRWAGEYGSLGHGVDVSEIFLAAARERAAALGVTGRVTYVLGDAGTYTDERRYDVVSCLGATWIGGGLGGTLELMKRFAEPEGLLVVGEPYWVSEPPADAYGAIGCAPEDFASLVGTLERVESAGLTLIEMVLADGDSWDRYVASQWWTIDRWLRANPDDPQAPAMREFAESARRSYLAYGRQYLGWGVFVLAQHVMTWTYSPPSTEEEL